MPVDAGAEIIWSQMALIECGTSAVPFLLHEAMAGHRDTTVRTALHRIFMTLPRGLGRGSFPPYRSISQKATELLRLIGPPVELVLPALEPGLKGTDPLRRRQALFFLGVIGSGAEAVVPYLVDALAVTNDIVQGTLAAQSLHQLGLRASNALPGVIAHLRESAALSTNTDVRRHPVRMLVRWLAAFGPAAAEAAPYIEPLLQTTHGPVRALGAVTLLHIDPEHPAAVRMVLETDQLPEPGASESAPAARLRREELLPAVAFGPARTNLVLSAVIAPMAQEEIRAWGPSGASYQALRALMKVDPVKAHDLCRGALDTPGAIYAAWWLLHMDRNDPDALKVLLEAAASGDEGQRFMAYTGLAEGSSANAELMEFLETTRRKPRSSTRRHHDPPRLADNALAWIRYREACEARGVSFGY